MSKRRAISQSKLASGLLVGLASGLAAASLGTVGTANASCVNFSGIKIGGGAALHCQASFGSFAIVIGPTPADGPGSDAFAGNPSQFGFLNFAVSVGGTATQPTNTSAGQFGAANLPNIGNVSFATAGSSATTAGLVNLAASFGGTRSTVVAAGGLNSGLNLGSDNQLFSTGVINNSTVLFGNENFAQSSNTPGGPGLVGALRPGLNVGFSIRGDNNSVFSGSAFPPGGPPAGNGPLAIAGAIAVDDQNLANGTEVKNTNFGIELRTPFNEQSPVSVLAAGRTQGNLVRPSLNAAVSKPNAASPGRPVLKAINQLQSSAKKFGDQIAASNKKFRDSVNATRGGAKAGAASSSSSNK